MTLLFLLENGSSPIVSLPEFFKSFWTSEFIVFEMNSRISSARGPGAISANTDSCKNRAQTNSVFIGYLYFWVFFKVSTDKERVKQLFNRIQPSKNTWEN